MTGASFTRLKREPDQPWGIRVPTSQAQPDPGDSILVVTRGGVEKQVRVGDKVIAFDDAVLYRIQDDRPAGPVPQETVKVTEPGVYEKDGEVYIVKPNREKTRLYAKRLVELRDTQGDRITDEDERVRIDFVYEPGVVFSLRPEDKMPLEKAKRLTVRYGRCIVCGRHLKVAESVERGIGPTCIKSFR